MNNVNNIPIEENELENYLKFHKVYPKIEIHDYNVHKFYLYVYLDPFDKFYHTFSIMGKNISFGYRPLYIGKATGAGYRHNQHIVEFAKSIFDMDKDNKTFPNKLKQEHFKDLDALMKRNHDINLPSNWNDYKKDWIIILDTANSQEELVQKEKNYINSIGTIRKNSGPLVNGTFG